MTVRRRSRTRSRSRGKTLSDVVARPTRSSKVRGHEGSHSPSQQHRRSYNAMDSFHHERNSEDRKSLPSRQRDQNSVHSRSRSPQFRHQATLPRERSLSAARGHGNVKTALPRPSSACDDSVSPSRGYSLSRMIPASSKPSLPPPPTRPGSVHNDCEDKQGQIEVIKDDDEEETSPSQVVPPTSTIDFRKRLDALRSRPTAPARAPTDEEIEIRRRVEALVKGKSKSESKVEGPDSAGSIGRRPYGGQTKLVRQLLRDSSSGGAFYRDEQFGFR